MGVPPKDPSQRRRTNTPERGEWIDISVERLTDDEVVLPPQEELDPQKQWDERTVQAWDAWRHDPVSVWYTPADVQMAIDTIELYSKFFSQKASEIRIRLDGLALTMKGKKDQRFRVKPALDIGHEATRTPQEPMGANVTNIDDRRKQLAHTAM